MPFHNIPQPERIPIAENLRLRKYDGNYEIALSGYQEPYVYNNSEGILDDAEKPDMEYVKSMFEYLDEVGELYFIEAMKDGEFIPVGDVTAKPENPAIAIWYGEFRGKGIGKKVMQAVLARLAELGYDKVTGTQVYKWNPHSLKMHQKLGYVIVGETEREYILERKL